jgi:formylglycine-generating enzyme required for sulfatase activity
MVVMMGLLIAAAQPAMGKSSIFREPFTTMTPSSGNGSHAVAQAGDYVGLDADCCGQTGVALKNGWAGHGGIGHFHAVQNAPRAGLGSGIGLGNNYDGCGGSGCGAAHATTVDADTDTVIFSIVVRTGFISGPLISSGEGKIFLGDANLLTTTGGAINAYKVDIDSGLGASGVTDGDFGLVTAGSDVGSAGYSAPAITDFYMIRITVTDVGTAGEAAILEIADVDDGTGLPNTSFTLAGTFPSSGGAFALTHIALVSINDAGGGGQSAKIWDNIEVEALDVLSAPLDIETVPVANAGNAANGDGNGAVSYNYNIGKYEVTADEYRVYLNATASTDIRGSWDDGMTNPGTIGTPYHTGCMITRNGTNGVYTYDFSGRPVGTAEADWASKPANYLTLFDVMRFINWLHNGQPTGVLQNNSSTDAGVYFLDGQYHEDVGPKNIEGADLVPHAVDATWWIPTEDEWYKAAWHKNDGVTGNYWTYPTSSDTLPGRDVNETTSPSNNANYAFGVDTGLLLGMPYMRTDVGEFELSASPYGTFNQAGNVKEWNETIQGMGSPTITYWGIRGGNYRNVSSHMTPTYDPFGLTANNEGGIYGFRVATEYIDPIPPITPTRGLIMIVH